MIFEDFEVTSHKLQTNTHITLRNLLRKSKQIVFRFVSIS